MTDDMGYADISCYGRKDYSTPNIDKLASQGMRFLNAYSGAPICTPTRVSFMTGRYPARTEVGLFEPLRGMKDSLIGLRPEQTSIATLLKKAGYETALIGKWHLGFLPQYNPNANGFNEFYGCHSGAVDYISHVAPTNQPDFYHNATPIQKEGYFADLVTEHAVQYLKKKHSKPFFLSLQFTSPHWPWQAPGDKPYPDTMNWRAGGSKAIFRAMMQNLDSSVGIILNAIDDAELYANTVVIFTSDNGGEKYSDMGMYSGHKAQLLEGGLRVPAFIRWPGKIKANSSSHQVAITMDWTATILAISGATADPNFPIDGQNLIEICTGRKQAFDRELYWRTFQVGNQKAMRDGNWKYLKMEQGEFLFDLAADPSEKNDLKEKSPEIFEKLKSKYTEWEKAVLQPIPL